MIPLFFYDQHNRSFFAMIYQRMQEGGMFFMFPIFLLMLLSFFIVILGVFSIKNGGIKLPKYIKLLSSVGLLTLVWGVLGQLMRLVETLDRIDGIGEVSASVLAGGLKVTALPTIFACFVFVCTRVAIIIFTWLQKTETFS